MPIIPKGTLRGARVLWYPIVIFIKSLYCSVFTAILISRGLDWTGIVQRVDNLQWCNPLLMELVWGIYWYLVMWQNAIAIGKFFSVVTSYRIIRFPFSVAWFLNRRYGDVFLWSLVLNRIKIASIMIMLDILLGYVWKISVFQFVLVLRDGLIVCL